MGTIAVALVLLSIIWICQIHSIEADGSIAIVTQISAGWIENALLLFRSVNAVSMEAVNGNNLELHACVDDSVTSSSAWTMPIQHEFNKSGVTLHQFHMPFTAFPITISPATINRREDVDWRNLLCLAQIASYYSDIERFDALIVFIGYKYFIVDNLWPSVLSPLQNQLLAKVNVKESLGLPRISCVPFQTQLIMSSSICNMNLIAMSSFIGTEFYAFLNTSVVHSDATAHDVLLAATRSMTIDILFWKYTDYVLQAGNVWWTKRKFSSNYSMISVVELDGVRHAITVDHCKLHVFGQDTFGNSLAVLQDKVISLEESLLRLSMITGCEPHSESYHPTNNNKMKVTTQSIVRSNIDFVENVDPFQEDDSFNPTTSVKVTQVRIFDTFLFNDELELLLLRLEMLLDVVNHHIIVESTRTFTGAGKPSYFDENAQLFERFSHRITRVVIDLPFPSPNNNSKLIWDNEYASRNAILFGLTSLHAQEEDIVLIADVDELPHPISIHNLRTLYHPKRINRHRIYKLYPVQLMYNFNCYVGTGGPLSLTSLTAGTVKLLRALEPNEACMTNARHFMQSETVYPESNVLLPGHWHLSFFGGLDRIRNKLHSYSHQEVLMNLTPQYASGDDVSVADTTIIIEKIARGEQIDGKSAITCQVIDGDTDFVRLKQRWDDVILRVAAFTAHRTNA